MRCQAALLHEVQLQSITISKEYPRCETRLHALTWRAERPFAERPVTVHSMFMRAQSSVGRNSFVWAYKIKITNQSEKTVTLQSRRWIILHDDGHQNEVRCVQRSAPKASWG